MRLTDESLERPSVVLLATLGMVLLGLYSLATLSTERDPKVDIPLVLVYLPYPGAAPEDVEAEVLHPLEEQLAALEGIDVLRGVAVSSMAIGVIQFEDDVDLDRAKREVAQAVRNARPEFPDEVEAEVLRTISFTNTPIVLYHLWGIDDRERLHDAADDLREQFEALPGVSYVSVFGGLDQDVLVEADPLALGAQGMTLAELADHLRRRNRNDPGGEVTMGAARVFHRSVGRFGTDDGLAALRATPVPLPTGGSLPLGELAQVRIGPAEEQSRARFQAAGLGPRTACVTLLVHRQPEANAVAVIDRTERAVAAFAGRLPAGVTVTPSNDQRKVIAIMTSQLGSSALWGGLLVVAVLCLALGLRNALLIASAIPFSLLVAFILMKFLGMTLNSITLFGLILILGMVVDGAIIVGENIYRQHERGLRGRAASREGLREIGTAVVSADVTTIAAYLPMLLVVGVMGQFVSFLPKVVAFTLGGSMLVDHLILPVLAAKWMRAPDAPAGWFARIERLFLPLQRAFDRGLTALRARYEPLLAASLRRPARVLALSGGLFLAALTVMGSGLLGDEFIPTVDMDRFTVALRMPADTPLEVTACEVARLEALLDDYAARHPGVIESSVTTIGETGALNADPRESDEAGPNHAKIAVDLVTAGARDVSQSGVVAELEARMRDAVAGGVVTFEELREGPPVGAAIAVRLYHDDLDALERAARHVERRLAEVPGAIRVGNDFRTRRREWQSRYSDAAGRHTGAAAAAAGRSLFLAIQGEEVSKIVEDDRQWDLRVRAVDAFRRDPDLLALLGVPRPGAAPVPLAAVADLAPGTSWRVIQHRTRRRVATVRCDTEGRDVPVVRADLQARLAEDRAAGALPAGLELEYGGETDERDDSMASLLDAMIVAVLLILFILALQFNSIRQTLVVLTTVPLAMVGVVYGLLLTNHKLGFMPFLGIVALTGIIVNDAIVLVDRMNQNRRLRGLPLDEAIRDAGHARLRPVLLTTVTTIAGLLPLGLNLTGSGEFWQPLCWTIVFGLLAATLLTLVVVPTLYLLVERRRAARGKRDAPAAPAA